MSPITVSRFDFFSHVNLGEICKEGGNCILPQGQDKAGVHACVLEREWLLRLSSSSIVPVYCISFFDLFLQVLHFCIRSLLLIFVCFVCFGLILWLHDFFSYIVLPNLCLKVSWILAWPATKTFLMDFFHRHLLWMFNYVLPGLNCYPYTKASRSTFDHRLFHWFF